MAGILKLNHMLNTWVLGKLQSELAEIYVVAFMGSCHKCSPADTNLFSPSQLNLGYCATTAIHEFRYAGYVGSQVALQLYYCD